MRTCLAISMTVLLHACDVDPQYSGADLYMANCSNCHGVYGEGDGVASPELRVVLLDLRYISARNGGTFPREFVAQIIDGRTLRVAHGPAGMPVWGAEFQRGEGYDARSEARVQAKIAALVEFVESIQIPASE